MTSSFCHPPDVDVFFHLITCKGRINLISDSICANLHTIAVLVGSTAVDSSSELHL
jgi:hypothetical protein